MIAVSQVGREIRISPVRRYQLNNTAVASDAVKFAHYRHRIANVFDDVATDHFIKLVRSERIRQVVQIVYYISRRARVYVHADRARYFVRAAADVQDSPDARFN